MAQSGISFYKIMNIENEVEIWKDVVGYEGLYQVSSFGNVKSIARNTSRGGMLRLINGNKGYLGIRLCKNGKTKSFQVHVLVAIVFHGHKPDGFKIVVDHDDNNKLNNRADNLRLVTNRENASKDKKGGSSNFIGVFWDKNANKWRASIYFKGRQVDLGCFSFDIDAANAYQKAKKEADEGLDLNVLYPKGRNRASKFKYVSFCKKFNKWLAKYKGKRIGLFNTEIEAHEAVQNYIFKYNYI
jgi:hypothetical protein